ncbi:hypothetical protein ACI798_05425 [Geodermatophilus sp. SYSU D01045]
MTGRHAGEPVELRLRLEPTLLAGVALVVLQTVVRALVVLPSYYWQDDFHHLDLARRLGLSQAFLVRDYSGHLEIGQYVLYWLVGRDLGTSFLPAALVLLLLQLVASGLLLAVLRLLFGRSPWVLVAFAGYLFTPLGLPVATWWAAGMQALPLQVAMLLALLGAVHSVRGGRRRWAVVSVAGTVLGLLMWEKAVLVVPTVLAVLVLVEGAGRPVADRVRLLLRHRRLLLAHLVALAGYTVLYLSVVDSAAVVGGGSADTLTGAGETVLRTLLPGLFGGPWTDSGAENTVYPRVGDAIVVLVVLLAAAVVALSGWLRGRRALQGWLLAAGYVAVDVGLLLVGRADYLGLVARDPRYVTDALPVVAIGVCAAFTGPLVQRRLPRWWPGTTGAAPAGSPLAAVAVLVSSCLLSTSLLADGLQHRYSRDWVLGVVRALEEEPGVSVVPTPLPTNVSVSTDLEGLLRAVGHEQELGRPGTDVRVVDGLARLRPVTVVAPTLQATGPVPDCGWRVEGGWQRLGTVAQAGPGTQVLRLGYLTGQPATLHVLVGGVEQALVLPPGVGHATFVVTGLQGPVTARVSDVATGGICVSDVVAGAPWPAG